MNREEFRDQLLAPVYQWTSLGRQSSKLMVAAGEVVSLRYRRLLWRSPHAETYDWAELAQMTKEKVIVPMECAAAMGSVLPVLTANFVVQTGGALLACARAAASVATSHGKEEMVEHAQTLCHALRAVVATCWQLGGCTAELASAGVVPLLRQVSENSHRLGRRQSNAASLNSARCVRKC